MALDLKRNLLNGITRVNRRLFASELPPRVAFYFHCLNDHELSPFAEFLAWLRASSFQFCSLNAYLAADGPEKRAFISFDDNYVSWHEQLPLFARHGLACTFYTNTAPLRDRSTTLDQQTYFDRIGHRGKRVALSSAEVREIAAAGHTVGCHTHTHRKLSELPLAEGRQEMLKSKHILEDLIGKPVDDFSYPFGIPRYFPGALKDYAKTIGFRTIADAMPCMLHAPIDPIAIQRHTWRLQASVEQNARDAAIDGRLFVQVFGRSPIG
jgi:peptidoglycan/xylan/chitin deacetylase (PgdA/CDA1 family)